jgi:hypothetical protein
MRVLTVMTLPWAANKIGFDACRDWGRNRKEQVQIDVSNCHQIKTPTPQDMHMSKINFLCVFETCA